MYADFEFYSNKYNPGTELTQADMNMYLLRASMYLDSLFLRPPPDPIDDRIKYAACEIADLYLDNASSENIASENNDGYSVSIDKSVPVQTKAYAIACRCLANTGLLYRGSCCE